MLLSVLSVTSCRSAKTTVETETVYIDRCLVDTFIKVEPDTATLNALLECDSLGNVLISQLTSLQGQRVSVAPQIIYRNVADSTGRVRREAYLSVIALADSLQREVSFLEEQIQKSRKKTEEKTKSTHPFKMFCIGMLLGTILMILFQIFIKK